MPPYRQSDGARAHGFQSIVELSGEPRATMKAGRGRGQCPSAHVGRAGMKTGCTAIIGDDCDRTNRRRIRASLIHPLNKITESDPYPRRIQHALHRSLRSAHSTRRRPGACIMKIPTDGAVPPGTWYCRGTKKIPPLVPWYRGTAIGKGGTSAVGRHDHPGSHFAGELRKARFLARFSHGAPANPALGRRQRTLFLA